MKGPMVIAKQMQEQLDAMKEATNLWRAEDPTRAESFPTQQELVPFLMGLINKLRTAIKVAAKEIDCIDCGDPDKAAMATRLRRLL